MFLVDNCFFLSVQGYLSNKLDSSDMTIFHDPWNSAVRLFPCCTSLGTEAFTSLKGLLVNQIHHINRTENNSRCLFVNCSHSFRSIVGMKHESKNYGHLLLLVIVSMGLVFMMNNSEIFASGTDGGSIRVPAEWEPQDAIWLQ